MDHARILLADDDPGDQILMRRALKFAGVTSRLFVVKDGEEALDYLLRRGNFHSEKEAPLPDILLLDLNMPKIDGRQVLTEITENPDCPKIPVIVLTTSTQDEDVRRSLSMGVKSYVTKPDTFDEYVDITVALATDLPRLAAIRSGLREQAQSPLCDAPRLASNLLAVLRDVWRRWCDHIPLDSD